MARTTSARGVQQIKLREGEVLKGYKDSKGLLTIGVGHLVKSGEPYKLHQPITAAESTRLLKQDLAKAEYAVNSAVKVPLTQNQFDALVSFTVNIGTAGFRGSSVVTHLNDGDYSGAARAMMKWIKPPEITGRRRGEQRQFLSDDPEDEQPDDQKPKPDEPEDADTDDADDDTDDSAEDQSRPQPLIQPIPGGGPTDAPVTVTKERPSYFVKIIASVTAFFGFFTNLGLSLQAFFDRAAAAITMRQIIILGVGLGLVAFALWFYDRAAQRANKLNQQKLANAANPNLINTELIKGP